MTAFLTPLVLPAFTLAALLTPLFWPALILSALALPAFLTSLVLAAFSLWVLAAALILAALGLAVLFATAFLAALLLAALCLTPLLLAPSFLSAFGLAALFGAPFVALAFRLAALLLAPLFSVAFAPLLGVALALTFRGALTPALITRPFVAALSIAAFPAAFLAWFGALTALLALLGALAPPFLPLAPALLAGKIAVIVLGKNDGRLAAGNGRGEDGGRCQRRILQTRAPGALSEPTGQTEGRESGRGVHARQMQTAPVGDRCRVLTVERQALGGWTLKGAGIALLAAPAASLFTHLAALSTGPLEGLA
ncbi:MAG: hypothetical protein ROR55_16205 [Devosia sp.]